MKAVSTVNGKTKMDSNVTIVEHCGTCKHWNKMPADPNDLGAKPMGQCREQLHVITIPRQVPGISGNMMVIELNPVYPSIPSDYPSCSRHVTRE
jgi:hypothetical protein